MVEISCFVVLDYGLLAGSVYQFWAGGLQSFHCGAQLCRPAIVAQENTVSLCRVIDIASCSHSVEQDIKVLAAACDDNIDCRNIFRSFPREAELWSLWLAESDASEEHRKLCGSYNVYKVNLCSKLK